MTKFWMVYNPLRLPPSFKHHSEVSANTEAERLARQHPGEIFFVLETISSVRANDVQWHNLQEII